MLEKGDCMMRIWFAAAMVLIQGFVASDPVKLDGIPVEAKDIRLALPRHMELFLPLQDGDPAVLANFADFYQGDRIPQNGMKITIAVQDKEPQQSLEQLVKAETEHTQIDKSKLTIAGRPALKVTIAHQDDAHIGEVSDVVYFEYLDSVYKLSLSTRWEDRDRKEFNDIFCRLLQSVRWLR